jgi:hypothetical protein
MEHKNPLLGGHSLLYRETNLINDWVIVTESLLQEC